MSDTHTVPTHEVVLPPRPESKWQRERRAFLRLLPSLLQTHRGQYVVVHDEKVVDSGDDETTLALRAYDRFGYGPICVGLITEEPRRVERIPTPRFLR